MKRKKIRPSYDHPAKQTVRSHWTGLLARTWTAAQRRHVRVWFLPGPQTLELPGYRTINIPSNHLQGFERNRAYTQAIRASHADLPLFTGQLKMALTDAAGVSLAPPNAANLDFDGSFFSFADEMTEVIHRLRLDPDPCLGVTSIATRDRSKLPKSLLSLSLWMGLFPVSFDQGVDLTRMDNERLGLVMQEPSATYAICRELALLFHILDAFGSRTYGQEDAEAAAIFRSRVSSLLSQARRELSPRTDAIIGNATAIPLVRIEKIRQAFMERTIPVGIGEWQRFCYQSNPGRKWRWTWHFRFFHLPSRVPLLTWAQAMLFHRPPLHVVDFTGVVVGDRKNGVCQLCQTRK